MSSKRNSNEYPEIDPTDPDSLDEYYENTKLEARFDPLTIQLLVVEAFPKHEAYGMSFSDYNRKRSQLSGYDDSKEKHLSFYFPKFFARVSSDLALINKTSHHRFLILLVELGLITFHVDFKDEYETLKHSRPKILNNLKNSVNRRHYIRLEKQTISLDSAAGSRSGGAHHFSSSVPVWLHNAVTDAANYTNMSISDFVYLCWGIGITNSLPEDMIPVIVGQDLSELLHQFRFEVSEYSDIIKTILDKMENSYV